MLSIALVVLDSTSSNAKQPNERGWNYSNLMSSGLRCVGNAKRFSRSLKYNTGLRPHLHQLRQFSRRSFPLLDNLPVGSTDADL